MRDLGHWEPELDFSIDDYFGFVYKITNIQTQRSYIGRKQFHSYIRKKIKGKKNRKKIVRESDWKTYTGSSEILNEDINRMGKDKFIYTIMKLCVTKRDLGYYETWYQMTESVLDSKFPDGTRKYYNNNIMSRWFATEG